MKKLLLFLFSVTTLGTAGLAINQPTSAEIFTFEGYQNGSFKVKIKLDGTNDTIKIKDLLNQRGFTEIKDVRYDGFTMIDPNSHQIMDVIIAKLAKRKENKTFELLIKADNYRPNSPVVKPHHRGQHKASLFNSAQPVSTGQVNPSSSFSSSGKKVEHSSDTSDTSDTISEQDQLARTVQPKAMKKEVVPPPKPVLQSIPPKAIEPCSMTILEDTGLTKTTAPRVVKKEVVVPPKPVLQSIPRTVATTPATSLSTEPETKSEKIDFDWRAMMRSQVPEPSRKPLVKPADYGANLQRLMEVSGQPKRNCARCYNFHQYNYKDALADLSAFTQSSH